MHPDLVPDEARRRFHEDGVTQLRGIFTEWVEPLRQAVAAVMADPSPQHRRHGEGAGGSFFTDVYMWRRHPTFRAFIEESPAASIAASLMGARTIRLYNEHLLVKEPGSEAETPWHQDLPYYHLQGSQCCSLWLALDSVTLETGAVRYVQGSHLWGKAYRPVTFSQGRAIANEDDFDEDMPDIGANPQAFPLVDYDLEPGDCTVHHGLTLHGAPANQSSDRVRRGISYRFIGDDITFRRRQFAAPLPEAIDLPDGAVLDHPLFPLVPLR